MTPPSCGRVLITTDAVGGVWVYASELARGLCARGWHATLVVMGPPPHAQQLRALQGIDALEIEITDVPLEWLDPDGSGLPHSQDVLLSIADRVRPDVVHLNTYREAAFGWPAPVLVVAHSCVLSWWAATRGGAPDEARWQRYACAAGAGLAAADVWCAPTRTFRDTIAALYRPGQTGRVIRNGVAQPPPSCTPKEPFILAAGRFWDAAKNLCALDAVASQLDWPVRAAGPMRESGASADAVPAECIDWLGSLSRTSLIAVMERASIFVSPALYEPFGLSVLEAAACGSALVLSDIPSFRELWNDAALFVDARDPQALAAALRRLCGHGILRQTLQESARKRARRYSLDATVNAYENLYRALMRQASVASGADTAALAELHA